MGSSMTYFYKNGLVERNRKTQIALLFLGQYGSKKIYQHS